MDSTSACTFSATSPEGAVYSHFHTLPPLHSTVSTIFTCARGTDATLALGSSEPYTARGSVTFVAIFTKFINCQSPQRATAMRRRRQRLPRGVYIQVTITQDVQIALVNTITTYNNAVHPKCHETKFASR